MPQRPQPSLRLADGGNFVTRWAQNVMRPKNTEQRLRQIEAPSPAPVAQPAPPPAPRPPNPNATPDNPAGIRFQDGGGLSKDAVMEAIARQRAAAGGQSGGGSGPQPQQPQPQPQPQQPSMMRDFLRNPGSVLRERERAAGLRFQDGGQLRENPVGEYMRRVGEEWSRSNADFEGGNPGVMQRVGRAVNPLTGFGSSVGAMYDAAGSGDVTGMALAAGSSIPAFAAARTAKTVAGPLRAASTGGTAARAGQNTAFGVGADYYTPGLQDGGMVPGSGTGDKIPAKYEPGEFVVSNDMIDDNPGLREQLSGLRAETLAARGKTVEEADAKALRYHGGLRAQAGFNGSADPDFWRGNPNPLQGNQANQTLLDAARQRIDPVQTAARNAAAAPAGGATRAPGYGPLSRMANDLTGQNSLPPKSPVGNMADDLARNARAAAPEGPTARPTAPLSAADAAAYDASPEGRATKVQALKEGRGYFQGKPNAAAAPAGAPAPPAPAAPSTTSKLFGSADDWKKFASGPADSPHKTGRLTLPEAPSGKPGMAGKAVGVLGKAAGAAQGLVGAYDVYKGVQEGDMQRAGVGAADALAAGALFTPAAPVAGAYLGARGAWDSGKAIYDNLSGGTQDVIGGTVNQIGLNTGLWGEDNSAKLMADAQARAWQPADTLRKTAPGATPTPDLRNPYASVTPEQGRAMAEINARVPERAPGSQPAPFDFDTFEPGPGEGAFRNEQTGKVTRLMSTPQGGAAWRAVPSQQATPSPAPRARQEVRVPVLNPNGGVFAAMADFTNQAGHAVQAIAANKGLRNDRKDALDAESTFAKIDQGDRELQIRGRDVDIREKDLGLRRADGIASAWAKQQELAYNRQRDALKDAMDIEKHNQTIGHNATNNARDRLKGMAVRDDGKGGTVVDEGRLARLESTLTKMSPGWAQADEATQAKLLRKAEASVNILEGLNSQRNNGWFQALGIDGKSVQLDNLPYKEMKGGKLNEVDFVDGISTPDTSRNDYVIETPGGRKMYLPRSSVNQGELELLESLGVDVTGSKK